MSRDLDFSEHDFLRIRRLMQEWVGISLKPAKKSLVYNRLLKRLRQHGLCNFAPYLDLVESDATEREGFINALTTNLTAFFREPHHFETLAAFLQQLPKRRPIQIWCAAASTGEEPYSIAMTVWETLGAEAASRVHLIASDLDTQVLAHAQAGIYRLDQVAKLGEERLRRFFLQGSGAWGGKVKVKPALEAMVTFRQVNLLDPSWPVRGPLDAIFCRNVMIYFDQATQLVVLERFAPLLAPHGLLFVGHSESIMHAGHLFRAQGRTVYRLAARGG